MNKSSKKRDFIFQLEEKFLFLKENQIARNICGHKNNSENSFANAVSIPRKTLLDGVQVSALNGENQLKLAQKCAFSIDWPEWNDPLANRKTPADKRRDTADAFEKRYLRSHAPNPNKAIADRTPSAVAAHRAALPHSIDEKLASVTLSAGQRGPGESQPIGVELACVPAFLKIAELTVRRGQLKIDCGGSGLGNIDDRRKFLEAENFKRNPNDVAIALFGTPLQPAWEISLDDPPRTGWYITGNICEVDKLATGAVLTAWLEVYKKDLEALRESCGSEKSGGVRRSRAFRITDFQELSEAKAAVLALLATCAICGDADYVVLCDDSLEFRPIEASSGEGSDE